MFLKKEAYYFYTDNTKSINLNLIKKNLNIFIIYRNNSKPESTKDIIKFRKSCKKHRFKFYVANNYNLAKKSKCDGLYISSYNNKKYYNIKTIGSAHNIREIKQKINQNCKTVILSRLFKVNYKTKKTVLGVIRFNLISRYFKINIVPLGGINGHNLLKLNLVNSKGFALLSEIKKKPAISSRLFQFFQKIN